MITMFVRQLIAVGCLLLAVEFLDAKIINKHKKKSELEARQVECSDGYRKCPTSSRCIRATWFCDGDNDCGDFSDEKNCRERQCEEGEFKCNNGQCISLTGYCVNGSPGCRDDTNTSLLCIAPLVCSSSNHVPCPNVRQCINKRYFCDNDNDCGDNSDEEESFCSTRTCQPDEVRCNSGQCINKDDFCGEMYTCRDGSLSTNSEICQYAQHPSWQFDQDGPSEAEMQCLMAMLQAQSACMNFPLFQELNSLGPDAAYNKLIEIDMRELCGAVQQPLQCFKNSLSECSSGDNPMLQAMKRRITLAEQVFDIVCVQEAELINRHKACLLRKDNSAQEPVPLIASALSTTCARLAPPGPINCIPVNIVVCAKNVIAQQCGDEIADVIDDIASRANSISGCSSYHKRSKSEPLRKRTPAFPFQTSLFKKYFFSRR